MGGYLRAELLRTRWTLTMALPVILLLIGAGSLLFSAGLSGTRLSSAHLYPVALLLPLAATVAAVGEHRESRWRGGGSIWRRTSLIRLYLARGIVVAISALLGHALMALLLAPDPAVGAAFVLVETLAFLGGWCFGLLIARFLGPAGVAVAPVAAFVWSLAGVFSAESPRWWILPWTWPIRPTIPLYGVHANSVPLEPGDPLSSLDPWLPILLHSIGGLLLFALSLSVPRLAWRGTSSVGAPRLPRTTRRNVFLALTHPLPWRIWAGLAVLMWVLLAVIRLGWGAATSAGAFSFLAVPLAGTVVGVTSWAAQQSGWPGVLYRSTRRHAYVAVLLLCLAFAIPVLLVGALTAGATAGQLLATPVVAALVVAVTLWLATVTPSLAILLSLVVTAWSVLVGGDVLAGTWLWWTSAWSWTWTVVDTPQRLLPVILAGSAMAGLAAWAGRRRAGAQLG